MRRAYISAHVKDELAIKVIRDSVWEAVGASKYYSKVNPHITVVPPFTPKEGCKGEIRDLVQSIDIKGRDVNVKRIGVYENIHKPYVVLLCLDVDLGDVRDALMDSLKDLTTGRLIEPVRPHITLFKTGSWQDDISREMKTDIQHEVMNYTSLSNTEISRLKVEFKS